MRHRKDGRPLGRNSSHRRALFRNMVTSFLRYDRIETTEAKAHEVRSLADQMISLGKRGDLSARRMAASYLLDEKVLVRLFSDVAPRFQKRNGGYTRIVKTRARHGDGAPMAILELTELKNVGTPAQAGKSEVKEKIKPSPDKEVVKAS